MSYVPDSIKQGVRATYGHKYKFMNVMVKLIPSLRKEIDYSKILRFAKGLSYEHSLESQDIKDFDDNT